MIEPRFLIYIPDPYAVGNSRYFVGDQLRVTKLKSPRLVTEGPLVTFDVPTLVDDLRNNNLALPDDLIDICDAIRLNTGISRADGGEKRWNFWRHIKQHFESHSDWKRLHELHTMRATIPSDDALDSLILSSLRALSSLWSKVAKSLEQSGESQRFFQIENPVAQVFYNRQRIGIRIDKDKLSEFARLASNDKYSHYQLVSDTLRMSATGLTYWNIGSRLKNTDLVEIDASVTGYALRDRMKMASGNSSFALSFTKFLDAGRDSDVLARLGDGGDRAYPTIHTIGTVSGRILLADPYLQELRRRYRSIVRAEDGQTLRYFDYSQFEPGVMASLSGDPTLIELYNQGDVYLALSRSVFGNEEQRDLCKRIFLSFSYGMTAKGIASLVVGRADTSNRGVEIEEKIGLFFDKFGTLVDFKKNLERRLNEDGSVSTLMGNKRRRLQIGPLSPKERRWAVSQVIQGTASLIFKKALLNVKSKFGMDAIVVPMHDAILMQLPEDENLQHSERLVVELMKNAFHEYCPGVMVRVTCGSFDA